MGRQKRQGVNGAKLFRAKSCLGRSDCQSDVSQYYEAAQSQLKSPVWFGKACPFTVTGHPSSQCTTLSQVPPPSTPPLTFFWGGRGWVRGRVGGNFSFQTAHFRFHCNKSHKHTHTDILYIEFRSVGWRGRNGIRTSLGSLAVHKLAAILLSSQTLTVSLDVTG